MIWKDDQHAAAQRGFMARESEGHLAGRGDKALSVCTLPEGSAEGGKTRSDAAAQSSTGITQARRSDRAHLAICGGEKKKRTTTMPCARR